MVHEKKTQLRQVVHIVTNSNSAQVVHL